MEKPPRGYYQDQGFGLDDNLLTVDDELLLGIRNAEELADLASSYLSRQVMFHTNLDLSSEHLDRLFKLLHLVAEERSKYLFDFVLDYNRELRKLGGDNAQRNHGPVIWLLTELLKLYTENVDYVGLCMMVLDSLTALEGNIKFIVDYHSVGVVLGSMAAQSEVRDLQLYGAGILSRLGRYLPDNERKAMVREAAVEILLQAMNAFENDLDIVVPSLVAIVRCAETLFQVKNDNERSDAMRELHKDAFSFVRGKCTEPVLEVQKTHPDDAVIQKECQRFMDLMAKDDSVGDKQGKVSPLEKEVDFPTDRASMEGSGMKLRLISLSPTQSSLENSSPDLEVEDIFKRNEGDKDNDEDEAGEMREGAICPVVEDEDVQNHNISEVLTPVPPVIVDQNSVTESLGLDHVHVVVEEPPVPSRSAFVIVSKNLLNNGDEKGEVSKGGDADQLAEVAQNEPQNLETATDLETTSDTSNCQNASQDRETTDDETRDTSDKNIQNNTEISIVVVSENNPNPPNESAENMRSESSTSSLDLACTRLQLRRTTYCVTSPTAAAAPVLSPGSDRTTSLSPGSENVSSPDCCDSHELKILSDIEDDSLEKSMAASSNDCNSLDEDSYSLSDCCSEGHDTFDTMAPMPRSISCPGLDKYYQSLEDSEDDIDDIADDSVDGGKRRRGWGSIHPPDVEGLLSNRSPSMIAECIEDAHRFRRLHLPPSHSEPDICSSLERKAWDPMPLNELLYLEEKSLESRSEVSSGTSQCSEADEEGIIDYLLSQPHGYIVQLLVCRTQVLLYVLSYWNRKRYLTVFDILGRPVLRVLEDVRLPAETADFARSRQTETVHSTFVSVLNQMTKVDCMTNKMKQKLVVASEKLLNQSLSPSLTMRICLCTEEVFRKWKQPDKKTIQSLMSTVAKLQKDEDTDEEIHKRLNRLLAVVEQNCEK